MLKQIWQKIFNYNWKFGLALIFVFGIPRFIIVLKANVSGNYTGIAFIFLCMIISPFLFLSKKGRKFIGLGRPSSYFWLLYAILLGAGICTVLFFAGTLLYDHSFSNWFVYIAKSYRIPVGAITSSQRNVYFLTYAISAMTFSPIGEEFFYRGIVHGSFVERFGERKSSILDSLAFAFTHLAHFGIVYIMGNWEFVLIPAMIWVLFMFISSRLFFFCKQKSGSLLGAIFCHAAFNVAMIYFIFYHIL